MLYDSECPLCMHEIRFLEKRNSKGLVKFTDIADPTYKPEENGGVDYEKGMKVIHAVMDDGSVIAGVPVFREVYKAVGLGWVFKVTEVPVVGKVAEEVYKVWAGWRMWLTGREELEVLFKRRRELKDGTSCGEKDCKL